MSYVKKVQIPNLGEVQGLYDSQNGITRFLGIPYGVVSKRWTRPVAQPSFSGGTHDGTMFGPICPQVFQQGAPSIYQLAVPGFPPNSVMRMDEFACLNMNIAKPDTTLGLLPVMVFIHGGGYARGSGNEIVYNGVDLVQTSIKAGNPILHVGINYRLGYFGFLASGDLKEGNGGKAVGNYGLWDQRLALEFIKSHISAFGGDPNLITLFGESAGSASVHAHLLAGVDLFSQAICQSGVLRTLGPLKVHDPYSEHRYRSLFATLHSDATMDLESLRSVPAEAIVEFTATQSGGILAAFFITDDTDCEDSFFPRDTDWVTCQTFCKRLMIGDCAVEGVILARIMAQIPPADIVKLLSSPPTLPATYLSQFGLSSSDLIRFDHRQQAGMKALIDFTTEITFQGPIEAVIEAAPSNSTYVFRFDRPNSWPGGPFAGIAHHTIDLLYLAAVPLKFPTTEAEKDRDLSELMMKQWTDFAVGKEPWRRRGTERWEMLYEKSGDVREVRGEDIRTRNLKMVGDVLVKNADEILRINVALSSGTVL